MITGAAGNLGRAVAAAFEQRGDRLLLLDRSQQDLAAAYGADSARLRRVAADLLQPQALREALGGLGSGWAGIDVLCNLAGGFTMGTPVHGTPEEDWERMRDLNVRTLQHAVACVVPGMIERRKGRVVNVGAFAAQRGAAGMGAYVASKAEVIRITESMALELREHGINVNCVLPTIIDTPQNRAAMPAADPARWVRPEQLAAVIAFLASDDAAAVHGACIPVTGLS